MWGFANFIGEQKVHLWHSSETHPEDYVACALHEAGHVRHWSQWRDAGREGPNPGHSEPEHETRAWGHAREIADELDVPWTDRMQDLSERLDPASHRYEVPLEERAWHESRKQGHEVSADDPVAAFLRKHQRGVKQVPYDDLPDSSKMAIHSYTHHGATGDMTGFDSAEEADQHMRSYTYGHTTIPMDELAHHIEDHEPESQGWLRSEPEEGRGPGRGTGNPDPNSTWSLIVNTPGQNPFRTVIDDGWNRLSHYLARGLKEVPAVWYGKSYAKPRSQGPPTSCHVCERGFWRNAARDDLPSAPGTEPIPKGHVRIYHSTWADPEEIKSGGLLMSKAQESYEKGSTEYPAIFGYAGHHPVLDTHESGGGANVVEFHLHPSDLDTGSYSTPEELEGRRSTVTTMKDVPASNIVAVHEPWHRQYRMIQGDPEIKRAVLDGEHDWALTDEGMKPLGDAIRRVKAEEGRQAARERYMKLPDESYIRHRGAAADVLDSEHPDSEYDPDPEAGRWVVRCRRHPSQSVYARTLHGAFEAADEPDWCLREHPSRTAALDEPDPGGECDASCRKTKMTIGDLWPHVATGLVDDTAMRDMADHLDEHGWNPDHDASDPLRLTPKGLWDGNHRVSAAHLLGWDDLEVPVHLHGVSRKEDFLYPVDSFRTASPWEPPAVKTCGVCGNEVRQEGTLEKHRARLRKLGPEHERVGEMWIPEGAEHLCRQCSQGGYELAKGLEEPIKYDRTPHPASGTKPIPEGHTRLWHFTRAPAESIREKGLLASESFDERNAGERVVWASPFDRTDQLGEEPGRRDRVVEFHVPAADAKMMEQSKHPIVTINRDVGPHEILDIYEGAERSRWGEQHG